MRKELSLALMSLIILAGVIQNTSSLKVKKGDEVVAGSDTQSSAKTQHGNAGAVSNSGSTANQNVANLSGVNAQPGDQTQLPVNIVEDISPDTIIAASNSSSKAESEVGNAAGVSIADSNAQRKEISEAPVKTDDLVVAVSTADASAKTQLGNAAAITMTSATAESLKYDLNGNLIDVDPVFVSAVPLKFWFETQLKAIDHSIGAEGDYYLVGKDTRLYIYDHPTNRLKLVEADIDLVGIKHVAVNYEGTPYVVTVTGETYYLSCDNKWIRLHGCATDIAAGRGGEIWKIGCEAKDGGFAVYRLFCKCACKCCSRGCKRYRQKKCSLDSVDAPKCHWLKIEGAGVSITVNNAGWPYVADVTHKVFAYDGTSWTQLPNIRALDLDFSNNDLLYIVGVNKKLYRVTNESNGTIQELNTEGVKAVSVTVGPFELPAFISDAGFVYISSKKEFN